MDFCDKYNLMSYDLVLIVCMQNGENVALKWYGMSTAVPALECLRSLNYDI